MNNKLPTSHPNLLSMPAKQSLIDAMSLSGFENWRPAVDVPHLNRPLCRPDDVPGVGRVAAVMILVFGDAPDSSDDGLKLVLTKRNANLSNHAGQISFPGGRQDEGETLEQTALRETEEEIGVARNEIEILGRLNPVYIPPSDFTVTPFVGWSSNPPHFVRSPDEVAEIIQAPISHLVDPRTLKIGDISTAKGVVKNVPFYEVNQHRVWGATAIMLGEFIERIKQVSHS